ncbi:hypothetical protein EWM64_g7788 [Hericium alpestre]|uniref:Uncharacterized protein n=1 Tax=Hericium alpestre TaxID=135208 RepID=A0A4Y9ZQ93_9AGAM|nr:hypothetical protein EWM64_g7788 [Hericium alpestre]
MARASSSHAAASGEVPHFLFSFLDPDDLDMYDLALASWGLMDDEHTDDSATWQQATAQPVFSVNPQVPVALQKVPAAHATKGPSSTAPSTTSRHPMSCHRLSTVHECHAVGHRLQFQHLRKARTALVCHALRTLTMKTHFTETFGVFHVHTVRIHVSIFRLRTARTLDTGYSSVLSMVLGNVIITASASTWTTIGKTS